ncbi:hypothetical protein [Clostridium sp. KNHs205]|uniref:hypothetical protein n=1 Tax=Clostridium sp. KNHs205 TaxID=1449050 RepID=UPI00051BF68A|nr:hypothetical protein [Clostridium sp. KNHs205]
MDDFEKEEEKLRMLEAMDRNCWETETDKNSSYEEVKKNFKEMIEEYEAIDEEMYSNGRDYDAENSDD